MKNKATGEGRDGDFFRVIIINCVDAPPRVSFFHTATFDILVVYDTAVLWVRFFIVGEKRGGGTSFDLRKADLYRTLIAPNWRFSRNNDAPPSH